MNNITMVWSLSNFYRHILAIFHSNFQPNHKQWSFHLLLCTHLYRILLSTVYIEISCYTKSLVNYW